MARGFIRERSGPKGTAFELRVYVGVDPANGRERRITRTVRGSRRTAERELTRLLAEVDEGGHAGPDATFARLLDEWQRLKAPRWSPKNAMEVAGRRRRHLRPLEDLRLRELTPARLDAFFGDLLASGLAAATVDRVRTDVSSALTLAVRWDWIMRNPVERCEEIPVPKPAIDPPSPAALTRLLDHLAAVDPPLALFVRLAAVTGRRRGELCALRWTDVDTDAAELVVARTLADSAEDGWVERPISKNPKRFPPLALDPTTVVLLRAHRTGTAERLLVLGLGLPPDAHLFLRITRDRTGLAPWSPDAVSHRIAKARDVVGADGVTLKELRHHVATTLLDAGVGVTTVAGRLGHGGGGRTTQEVYAHSVPASDRQAAELLARLLDQRPGGSETG